MKTAVRIALASALLAAIAVPALAMGLVPNDPKHYRGVPGPIAGAGLPILAIGYGVYWLVRRRHNSQ
jgi:hypothetical protein